MATLTPPQASTSTTSPSSPHTPPSGLQRYLLVCVQGPLSEFRLPELDSIAHLFNFKITYVDPVPDITRPYMLVDLPSDREAKLLGSRAISVKHIWAYWADADTYKELHELNKLKPENYTPYISPSNSWKFLVATFARTISLSEQIAIINSFRYTDFQGPIKMKGAMVEVGVFEEFVCAVKRRRKGEEGEDGEGEDEDGEVVDEGENPSEKRVESEMRRVWLGRKVRLHVFISFSLSLSSSFPDSPPSEFSPLPSDQHLTPLPFHQICDGQRDLIDHFNLKKRKYVGSTSMEAEVSLLMANQALAKEGKLVYDPFTGTGSMLLTSSQFGAMTFGSDIDGRQIRGKKTGLYHNADQYGVRSLIVDTPIFDVTQHPFRTGEIFHAIVTDPPYGVRAGAKRLGRKDTRIKEYVPHYVPGRESEGLSHQLPDYVPPSIPWEMTSVISSLITYSLYLLKPNGRLVFFLPTDNAEYRDVDIPVVEGMRLISNSSQSFGKWARRLITMEKVGSGEKELEGLDRGIEREGFENKKVKEKEGEEGARLAGHANFHQRYMQRFEKLSIDP